MGDSGLHHDHHSRSVMAANPVGCSSELGESQSLHRIGPTVEPPCCGASSFSSSGGFGPSRVLPRRGPAVALPCHDGVISSVPWLETLTANSLSGWIRE